MRLRRVLLHHFKSFEDYEVTFEDMNFIKGVIGSGKSSIAVEAPLFALYGYTTKATIADLTTRWIPTKSFFVETEFEHQGKKYTIKRSFPTKLEVRIDGILQKFATATEATNFLTSLFGDRLYFSKFRIIDAYSKEVNFLEEGPATLKKILFSASDELFNTVRTNLNNIKTEREKYNKDEAVVYKLYPSEKRLQILITGLEETTNKYNEADMEIDIKEKELQELKITIEQTKNNITYLKKQIEDIAHLKTQSDTKLRNTETLLTKNISRAEELQRKAEELRKQEATIKDTKVCYVCKRPLEEHSAADLLKEREEQINNHNIEYGALIKSNTDLESDIKKIKEDIENEKAQKLLDFKTEIEILENDIQGFTEGVPVIEEIVAKEKVKRDVLLSKKEKLNNLKTKLEGRIKQKAYIYTTKDILVVKKAIDELDRISSNYLVETVRVLEPIINSILEKIEFKAQFDVDTKGKFNILLEKKGIQYTYKDLSTGQRLLLQIAIKLSLLLQKNEEGLVIADEGMSALDKNTLLHVINMFANMPFQLVFVIHNVADLPAYVNIVNLDRGEEDVK